MAAPSPASEPDSERKYKLTLRRIDAVVTITKVAIKYASLVACVYLAYRALVALAGKQTLASVLLQVITDLKFHDGIYLILAAGSVSFDHPAYTLLRQRINMVIRYAHHFTLTAFIVVMIYVSPLKKNPEVAQWEEIVDSLPSPEVRNWLRACNTAVALTIFRHA